MRMNREVITGIVMLCIFAISPAQSQESKSLSFFVTSVGIGDGGNLGGLAGADNHCRILAEKVGAGHRVWRAYLSTQGPDAVNARDRIGNGPWYNANGALIGENVDHLHSHLTMMSMRDALTEEGRLVPGGGFTPNNHDILTGTQPDGTAFPIGEDMACKNWTSNSEGKARYGHHDRAAWNSSAHDSGGCSQEILRSGSSAGLFYCFAAD